MNKIDEFAARDKKTTRTKVVKKLGISMAASQFGRSYGAGRS